MQEQRRHQRIRFGTAPEVRIGHAGCAGHGGVENLSLSGLMLRTDMSLTIGQSAGCEFSICGSPVIDLAVNIVSRIGDLYGARFQPGLINPVLIEDAIGGALRSGQASVLSVHELGGRKVMRIAGGLNASLRNDFMHAITRVGVDEIDLAEVTAVEQAGLAFCLVASERHGAIIGRQSEAFAAAWALAQGMQGGRGSREYEF